MKALIKKIANAKKDIKSANLKKGGTNSFSKYNYFTPEQVETLVSNACESEGLITKFDLKRNEFGEYGVLTVIDTETGELTTYEMATAIPEIKATNIAQQLGGCVTYTERYLKMSAFGIVENANDFDAHDNRATTKEKKWLNPDTLEWSKAIKFLQEDGNTMADVKKGYKLSVTNEKLLMDSVL